MGNALICLPHSAVAEAVASRSIAASLVPRRHDAVATASMTLPARLLNGITGRVHVLQEGTTVAEVNCSILKSPTPSQLSPQTKIWRIDACTFSYQCINSTGEPLQKSSPSFLALQSWRWRRIPCCLHNHSYRQVRRHVAVLQLTSHVIIARLFLQITQTIHCHNPIPPFLQVSLRILYQRPISMDTGRSKSIFHPSIAPDPGSPPSRRSLNPLYALYHVLVLFTVPGSSVDSYLEIHFGNNIVYTVCWMCPNFVPCMQILSRNHEQISHERISL